MKYQYAVAAIKCMHHFFSIKPRNRFNIDNRETNVSLDGERDEEVRILVQKRVSGESDQRVCADDCVGLVKLTYPVTYPSSISRVTWSSMTMSLILTLKYTC